MSKIARFFLTIAVICGAFAAISVPSSAATQYPKSSFICCGTMQFEAGYLYTGGGNVGAGPDGSNYRSGGDTLPISTSVGESCTTSCVVTGSGIAIPKTFGMLSANGNYALVVAPYQAGTGQSTTGNVGLLYTCGNVCYWGGNCYPPAGSACLPTWQYFWGTGTTDLGAGVSLVLASNGALVVEDAGTVEWAVGAGSGAVKLVLQNSGDLQLLDANNNVVWHSNTAGCTTYLCQ